MTTGIIAAPAESWKEVVSRKQAVRNAALGKYLPIAKADSDDVAEFAVEDVIQYHSAKVKAITGIKELDELQTKIASGELSAADVISAYIERAVLVHQVTNCFTEVLFDEALAQARLLDEYFKTNGKVIGPLHGIPVTLKDQFNVKGVDTTLGYVGRASAPATEDAALVEIMKRLGAVVLGKTNLPQSIMWNETENPLWGLTTNPRNAAFTPGGSTGGEGALLATGGSFIGWGTDIGGSVRIPSAINGIYGFRPSSGRLPYIGTPVSTEGQEHVHSVVGPMARSLSSLITTTKAVIDSEPWRYDPRTHPIPWRQDQHLEAQSRPLVIGLILDDGVVKPHPPITRALLELSAKLTAAGHEVIPWDVTGHHEIVDILDTYYTSDGGEDIRRDIAAGGEPEIPHVTKFLARGSAISVYDYWQINRRKLAAQKAYLDRWNNTKGPKSGREVDVLLMPVAPHSAVPHRCSRWVGYTKVWNVLDYTALAFPASVVDKEVDILPEYTPRNDQDAWNWAVYDGESMHGHPVGLQIVGKRLEEEKVLGAAKVFRAVLER